MKRFLGTVFILLIVICCIGIWRGWFRVSNNAGPVGTDTVNMEITVDKGRVRHDADAVKDATRDAARQVERTLSDGDTLK